MEKMEKMENIKLKTKNTISMIQNTLFVNQMNQTKSDEFLEKIPNGLRPPLIFGKLYCKFYKTDMIANMQGGMIGR